jgi:NAD(P)-dependent dehydrogenase (short-subunit alcohol dehydrogenase family)
MLTGDRPTGDLHIGHYLVNCAGGWSPKGQNYPAAASEDWEGVLNLNLRGPMLLLHRLREPLGRSPVVACVSISSSAATGHGAYAAPAYAVAKAGLIRLTTALADWPGRYGVRVSCVVPGWIGLARANHCHGRGTATTESVRRLRHA